MHLVVRSPFPGHLRGDIITDAEQVGSVLSGPDRDRVNRIAAPPPSAEAEAAVEKAQAQLAQAEAALHT